MAQGARCRRPACSVGRGKGRRAACTTFWGRAARPDTDGRMTIFGPELVAKASELPSPALLTMAVLGPLFWVLGWRIHRVL